MKYQTCFLHQLKSIHYWTATPLWDNKNLTVTMSNKEKRVHCRHLGQQKVSGMLSSDTSVHSNCTISHRYRSISTLNWSCHKGHHIMGNGFLHLGCYWLLKTPGCVWSPQPLPPSWLFFFWIFFASSQRPFRRSVQLSSLLCVPFLFLPFTAWLFTAGLLLLVFLCDGLGYTRISSTSELLEVFAADKTLAAGEMDLPMSGWPLLQSWVIWV